MSENAIDNFTAIGNNLSIAPRCRHCGEFLAATDRQKKSGIYWKSCQKCRHERVAKDRAANERKRKALSIPADDAASFSTSEKKRRPSEKVLEKPSSFCKRAEEDAVDVVGLVHLVPLLELFVIVQIDWSVCHSKIFY